MRKLGLDPSLTLDEYLSEDARNVSKVATKFEDIGGKAWVKYVGWDDLTVQVVALMHMRVGAVLPPEIGKAAIEATEGEDLEEFSWKDPQARQERLDEFVKTLKEYDGTPTVVSDD